MTRRILAALVVILAGLAALDVLRVWRRLDVEPFSEPWGEC